MLVVSGKPKYYERCCHPFYYNVSGIVLLFKNYIGEYKTKTNLFQTKKIETLIVPKRNLMSVFRARQKSKISFVTCLVNSVKKKVWAPKNMKDDKKRQTKLSKNLRNDSRWPRNKNTRNNRTTWAHNQSIDHDPRSSSLPPKTFSVLKPQKYAHWQEIIETEAILYTSTKVVYKRPAHITML